MIKFEHSVFALPFALTGALLAWRDDGFVREGLWVKLAWIVVAMVAARSVAMAFNRVLDADIDARNPRTKARHLPAGLLSRRFAWGFIAVSAFVFIFAARELNPLCFKLAPLALAIPMFYSFTKRFTSHVAHRAGIFAGHRAGRRVDRDARVARPEHFMADGRGHAVDRWVRHHLRLPGLRVRRCSAGLFSVPKSIRNRAGACGSRARCTSGCWFACSRWCSSFALGAIAVAGIVAVGALLLWEHRLVKADDLSRIDAAFFTMNGYVSVIFFVFWATDIFLK